jgi:phosphotransferase system enzyme I (PtsI)
MQEYIGRSVCGGIAIGKVKSLIKSESLVKRLKVEDKAAEIARYKKAIVTAKAELGELYEKAVEDVGEENAAVFEVHQMMLEDEDYCESIENIINTESVNAEYAVAKTGDNFAEMFASMDDEYMKARSADVKDISERVIKILSGSTTAFSVMEDKVILVADDLTPSETVQIDKSKVLAFVTVHGSITSHTAILARTMNIPALIGTGIGNLKEIDGREAIVDGFLGSFLVEPDAGTLMQMKKKQMQEEEKKALLGQQRGKPTVTLDGKHIRLYANIGSIEDIAAAQSNDAEGIGLFRSEFIYLQAKDYPTEEEQFKIYQQALQLMGGKKLIIRTCDIGADKQADYFGIEREENPALGYRAIRICLDRPDFFRTQLRALFRASVYGNLSIMYPMIISTEEVKKIKSLVQTVQNELEQEGLPFKKDVEQGIMIETPAAAILSGELAKEVDFFSIGTNDLTQYTLAIDRQNPKLEAICDTHHPAILYLINMTIQNAHAAGKWVGICGELGADLTLTETFLQMGVDELSVSPGVLLNIRQKIRETDISRLPGEK